MKFDVQLKALLLCMCSAVLGIKDHLLLVSLISLINNPKVAILLPKSNIKDQEVLKSTLKLCQQEWLVNKTQKHPHSKNKASYIKSV